MTLPVLQGVTAQIVPHIDQLRREWRDAVASGIVDAREGAVVVLRCELLLQAVGADRAGSQGAYGVPGPAGTDQETTILPPLETDTRWGG